MKAAEVSAAPVAAMAKPMTRQSNQRSDFALAPSTTAAQANEEALQTVVSNGRAAAGQSQQSRKESLKKLADRLNDSASIVERRLKFKVQDETGDVYVQVTDAQTGKVLSTIPSESMLELEARLKDTGTPPSLVLDKRA